MKLFSLQKLSKCKRFFNFRRPYFRHLDCIDLVLENKLLLLLGWDTVHADKIRVLPGKIAYRTNSSAAICQLPIGTETIEVIASNFWRSSKVSFLLKHITLDEQTIEYLDKLFLKRIQISKVRPEITTADINLTIPHPGISLPLKFRVHHLFINYNLFNDYAP